MHGFVFFFFWLGKPHIFCEPLVQHQKPPNWIPRSILSRTLQSRWIATSTFSRNMRNKVLRFLLKMQKGMSHERASHGSCHGSYCSFLRYLMGVGARECLRQVWHLSICRERMAFFSIAWTRSMPRHHDVEVKLGPIWW